MLIHIIRQLLLRYCYDNISLMVMLPLMISHAPPHLIASPPPSPSITSEWREASLPLSCQLQIETFLEAGQIFRGHFSHWRWWYICINGHIYLITDEEGCWAEADGWWLSFQFQSPITPLPSFLMPPSLIADAYLAIYASAISRHWMFGFR